MKEHKYSRQREALRRVLVSTDTHPTAEWLYERLREEIPNISLGTVYRNLSLLVETGEAIRLDVGDGADHYDGRKAFHDHFSCRVCGRIYDLETAGRSRLMREASRLVDGEIDGYSLVFYGTCTNCVNSRPRPESIQGGNKA